MTKEALKLALEALELHGKQYPHMVKGYCLDAIAAIKEALANEALEKMAENARELGLDYESEQTEHGWTPERIAGMARLKEAQDKKLAQQEPVAWEQFYPEMGSPKLAYLLPTESRDNACYTPPQRTWVGLTDKDWNRSKHNYDFQKGVDWAESILKEKNA
jgi:hypothetical protein